MNGWAEMTPGGFLGVTTFTLPVATSGKEDRGLPWAETGLEQTSSKTDDSSLLTSTLQGLVASISASSSTIFSSSSESSDEYTKIGAEVILIKSMKLTEPSEELGDGGAETKSIEMRSRVEGEINDFVLCELGSAHGEVVVQFFGFQVQMGGIFVIFHPGIQDWRAGRSSLRNHLLHFTSSLFSG